MFLEIIVSALVIFAICFLFGYSKARKQKTLEELVTEKVKPETKKEKKTKTEVVKKKTTTKKKATKKTTTKKK